MPKDHDEHKPHTGEQKGASKAEAKADATRYETWISVHARLRVVITPSETIFSQGGMITKPGLSVQFEGGEYRVDTKDPNYSKIVKKFRELPRFAAGQLVCAQDLLRAGKRVDHALIGKNVRSALAKFGIQNKAQLERGLELMGAEQSEVVVKLQEALTKAHAETQAAKDAAAQAHAELAESKKK